MANRYWVGGTGTWNTSSTTNWSASSGGSSGASVPTAADSVFFDQAGTYTVTLTGALLCLNLTVSAGTVTFTSTGTIAISGSMSLVAATVWNGTGTITYNSTTAGNTITTNAVSISCAITFNGVGGSWQLQSALTSGATRTCTLTNGTLDLNGYTLSTGLFSSTNSNTRTLAFGAGKIVVTGTNVTIFNIGTSTNMTVSGTNPLVEATGAGTIAQTRGVAMGRFFSTPEAYSISLTVSAGADLISFSGGGAAFRNVSFVGFTGTFTIAQAQVVYGNWNFGGVTGMTGTPTITFGATSGTKTITSNSATFSNAISINGSGGTFACQDALSVTGALSITEGTLQLKSGTTSTIASISTSGSNQKFLQSTTPGSQATLSAASGTNTVSYLTIQDIAATGGATWNAYSTDNNINAGNNTGWDFFAQLSRYIYTRRKNKVISI